MTERIPSTDYIDFAPYDLPVDDRRKLDVGDIYINQVRHTTCGWYIRSKNRHDYRTCRCGGLSIDGGSWYTKLVGDVDHAESHVVLYKHVEKTPILLNAAVPQENSIWTHASNHQPITQPTGSPASPPSTRASSSSE